MKVPIGELREALEQHRYDGNTHVTSTQLAAYLPYSCRAIGPALTRLAHHGELEAVTDDTSPKLYRLPDADNEFASDREAAEYYLHKAKAEASGIPEYYVTLALDYLTNCLAEDTEDDTGEAEA